MFSRQHRKARVLFGLSDVVLTTLAFEAAYRTRVWLQLERVFYLTVRDKALVLGFALLVWVAMGAWLRVYEKLTVGDVRVILRDSVRQCFYSAICVVIFEYLLRLDLSRAFLLLFFGYSWLLLFLFRVTAGRVVGVIRRELAAPVYIMVVGTGERAQRLARMVERPVEYGMRLRGFLAEDAGAPREVLLESAYPVYPLAQLPVLLQHHVIDEIFFAVGSEKLAELEEVFLLCDEEGVRTRVAVDFFPHVNSTVDLERLGRTPLLTFSAAPHDESGCWSSA